MLTYGILPKFRGGVHLYFLNCLTPSGYPVVPSSSGHAIAYRWCSLPRVRRHRASKAQGSSEQMLPGQVTRDQPLSPFAPENLVSRDGLGSPVPRQPAHLHTQGETGAYLRDSSQVPRRRPFIFFKLPYAIGLPGSPEFIGSRNRVPMVFTAESPPAQGQ